MKTYNSKIALMICAALVSLVAACAGSNTSINSNTDAPGAAILGQNVDINDCQVDQAYNSQYGCMNRYSCQLGSGVAGATSSQGCITGQLITRQSKFGGNPISRTYGTLTITNPQQMEMMLQSNGLCTSQYGGYSVYANYSNVRCAQLISQGSFALVETYAAGGTNIVIGAGTLAPSDLISQIPGVYGYNGVVGSTNYMKINQEAQNLSFNGGDGFELIGMQQKHPINFMLIVNNGNLGMQNVDAQLVYQGTQVATMTLQHLSN